MKRFVEAPILALMILLSINACAAGIVNATLTGSPLPDDFWSVTLGFILAGYETVIRIIPTIKNYSLVNFIIKGLHWLSEKLNVVKP